MMIAARKDMTKLNPILWKPVPVRKSIDLLMRLQVDEKKNKTCRLVYLHINFRVPDQNGGCSWAYATPPAATHYHGCHYHLRCVCEKCIECISRDLEVAAHPHMCPAGR